MAARAGAEGFGGERGYSWGVSVTTAGLNNSGPSLTEAFGDKRTEGGKRRKKKKVQKPPNSTFISP